MEFVLRALFVYLFLMLIFTISGKRSMAQIDTFDFVLLLIISEATQQALVGQDYSITTAIIVIATLVGTELVMAAIKNRWPKFEKLTTGGPLIIVNEGKFLEERMNKEKVGVQEILCEARKKFGLERLEQIKYAILESNGEISIIPREGSVNWAR